MSDEYVFLVEGTSDERFVDSIISPKLRGDLTSIKYSQEPDPQVDTLINAFQGMYRQLYLLRDFDKGKQNCTNIGERQEFVQKKFNEINNRQIIIVADAVEGWYLAGLENAEAAELGIDVPSNTEHIGKNEFKKKLNNSEYSSEINLQREIIERYSIQTAKQKNSTFKYLFESIGI